jgi:site-specific recombinase XerD
MMQVITATAGTSLTAPQQDLTPDLFTRFVNWIDRSTKTARTYIVNLRQFVAWLHYSEITRPQRQDIISYREYLSSEHEAIQLHGNTWRYRTDSSGNRITILCKPNTITQYLRSVCAFFKWTAAEGLYPDIAANIHAPKVRHDTHRKEALTAQEVHQIETSITSNAAADLTEAEAARKDTAGRIQRSNEQGKRLYAMYMLTVTAGLRTIELARANNKPMTAGSDVHSVTIYGGGILTSTPINSPRDFIDLIMGDDMYLMTDGETFFDRYGNLCI